MDAEKMKRPRCPKCAGALVPEWDPFSDRVTSVGCVNCGHRIYRHYQVRRPSGKEIDALPEKGSHRNRGSAYSNRYVA